MPLLAANLAFYFCAAVAVVSTLGERCMKGGGKLKQVHTSSPYVGFHLYLGVAPGKGVIDCDKLDVQGNQRARELAPAV